MRQPRRKSVAASSAGIPSFIGPAWDKFLDGLAYAAATLVAAVTVSVAYEIIARYGFNRPTIWAVDFTEYALVYITFLAAPWALRDRAHTRVELFVERLGNRTQLKMGAACGLIAAAATAVMAREAILETWTAFTAGQAELKSWRVPRWSLIFPIALGSLALTVEFLRQVGNDIRSLLGAAPRNPPKRGAE